MSADIKQLVAELQERAAYERCIHRERAAQLLDKAASALEAAESDSKAMRARTIEECAQIAEAMPWHVNTSPAHVRGLCGSDVAAAIRSLATSTGDRS